MKASALRAKLREAVVAFFWRPTSGRAEAWFRVGYALVLLVEQLGLLPKLDLLFSNTGVHPATPFDFAYPIGLVRALFGVWVCAALLLLLGLRVRIAALVNLFACIYFFGLRGFAAPHGADWLLHSSAFYLALMHTDATLSLDRHFGWAPERRVRVWPRRLAQINLVSVYFSAGLAKLPDDGWVSGRAFGDALRHPLLAHFHSDVVGSQRALLSLVDWGVIGWELVFPVLIAVRRLRAFGLLSALVFNLCVFLSLRIGFFTLIASVGLLLFIDDPPFEPAPRDKVSVPNRLPWPLVFAVLHTSLLAVVMTGNVLLGLRMPGPGRVLTELPLVSTYTRRVAGFAYYDVFNSGFLMNPVRFIYYEASHPDGEPAGIEPFDETGAFHPPLAYFTEVREGLLSIRLATFPAPSSVWKAYFRYLVDKYRRQYSWQCPSEIRVYRIASPLDRFGSDPARLDVPKQPLVNATLRCVGREIDLTLSAPTSAAGANPRSHEPPARTRGLNSRAAR